MSVAKVLFALGMACSLGLAAAAEGQTDLAIGPLQDDRYTRAAMALPAIAVARPEARKATVLEAGAIGGMEDDAHTRRAQRGAQPMNPALCRRAGR